MTTIKLLHVDDEPDIREVVEISLALDSVFTTRNCGSGEEALTVAADWQPDIILLDVMMPLMDGPATLAGLRDNPKTARIPVIFMTARAQTRELDRFRALGAVGVIAKPFDPMTLATSIRNYIKPADDPLENLRAGFLQRAKKDAAALAALRIALETGNGEADTLASIRQIAHGLAGAGGIFGFADISDAAALLEDVVISEMDGPTTRGIVDHAISHLINCAENGGATTIKVPYLLEDA